MIFQKNKFGAFIKEDATQSFINFSNELSHSEMFIVMINIGSEYLEENRNQVKDILIREFEDYGNEPAEKLIDYLKSESADQLVSMRTYEQFYGQMCYARVVDNVLTYFKEILGEVIIKTPQILKSKEQERLDFILNFNTIEDLRVAIAKRKIEALFYAGIDKIESFFEERLGIKVFKNLDDRLVFNQIIKNRNLIVHNRGRVTKEYVKEFPSCGFEIDSYLFASYEDVSRISLALSNLLMILDHEIASKFDLELIRPSLGSMDA